MNQSWLLIPLNIHCFCPCLYKIQLFLRFSGWVSVSLFSCTFYSIASEKGDRNAKTGEKKSVLLKTLLDLLEVVFDFWDKGSMWKVGDANTLAKWFVTKQILNSRDGWSLSSTALHYLYFLYISAEYHQLYTATTSWTERIITTCLIELIYCKLFSIYWLAKLYAAWVTDCFVFHLACNLASLLFLRFFKRFTSHWDRKNLFSYSTLNHACQVRWGKAIKGLQGVVTLH